MVNKNVWFTSSGIEDWGGKLVYEEEVLGLHFCYFYFKKSKYLRGFYWDRERDPDFQYLLIADFSPRDFDKDAIQYFDSNMKFYLKNFMYRPEIKKKIEKYLLTNK